MIPIDCKITIFPYTCFFLLFKVMILRLTNSQVSLQKKEQPRIFFAGATPITEKFICHEALYYLRMFATLHSAIGRGDLKRSLLTTIWKCRKSTRDSMHLKDQLYLGLYTWCSVLSNNLKNDSTKRIAC